MYRCNDCGATFEHPKRSFQSHGHYGFGFYLQEPWSVCPYCEGDDLEYSEFGFEDEDEDEDYS